MIKKSVAVVAPNSTNLLMQAAHATIAELKDMQRLVAVTSTERLALAVTVVKPLEKASSELYSSVREELINRSLEVNANEEFAGLDRDGKGYSETLENGVKVSLSPREIMKERPGALAWLGFHFSAQEFGELTKTVVTINQDAVERYVQQGKLKMKDVTENLFEVKESWTLTTKKEKE